ncbi:hypothetical protein AB0E06_21200 [Streptomyces sp. NPDC048109]|uniref:hypothetical protein n=1 Tax=Streptomyces sp. NPDC048109 TaxID=3155482 RepID=UPI003421B35C
MTEPDVLEEIERLRRLVSMLMPPPGSRRSGAGGSASAWCGGDPGPAATDLQALDVTPQGYSDRYWVRYNWPTTWYGWQAYVAGCTYCRGRMCWGTHGRRTAHEETTPDAGQPQPVCGACADPILPTERACRTCGKARQHHTPATTGGSSLRRNTT